MEREFGKEKQYRNPLRGYHCLHTAIGGHSRLGYSELLADESKDAAAEFWSRQYLDHRKWRQRQKVVIANASTIYLHFR